MNTQRNAARRLEKEIANAGVPSRGYQVPPLKKVVNDDQALTNPPPTDENTRDDPTQALSTTTQTQDMMAHANREVIPRSNQ